MLEYSTVLGNELRGGLMGHFRYVLDMMINSPYFWPGVMITVVAVVLLARQLSK